LIYAYRTQCAVTPPARPIDNCKCHDTLLGRKFAAGERPYLSEKANDLTVTANDV